MFIYIAQNHTLYMCLFRVGALKIVQNTAACSLTLTSDKGKLPQ